MWYEDLGFENDPYDITTPSSILIGEEKQEKQILKRIPYRTIMLIYGETGTGKTTLLKKIKEKIDNNEIKDLENAKTLYYSIEGGEGKNISEDIERINKTTLQKILPFTKSFTKPKKEKIVVLLDEVNNPKYYNDIKTIKSKYDNQHVYNIIMTQIDETNINPALEDRAFEKVELRPLNENEIIEVLELRTGDVKIFDEKSLKYIAASRKQIRQALMDCDKICQEYIGKHKKTISLKDVEKYDTEEKKKVKQQKSKPRQRFIKTASEQKTPIETLKLTPFHKRIVDEIKVNPRTLAELENLLFTDKPQDEKDRKEIDNNIRNITSQLSKLVSRDIIMITKESKPKEYGLTPLIKKKLSHD